VTARSGPRPADLVRRIHGRLSAIYADAIPPLTIPQFVLLDALKRHGPHCAKDLGRLVAMDRSTCSDLLIRLRREGLVAGDRKPGPVKVPLTITNAGRRLLNTAESALWNAEVEMLAGLTPQERAQFLNCMNTAAFGVKP